MRTDPVVLDLPVVGRWQARNSPARRVPSHGTHLFATTWAVDLVAVEGRRSARTTDWRTLLASEAPERFVGFGMAVLAPATGTVVTVHDGEPDHVARRSLPAGLPYLLRQRSRVRAGAGAVAGNHVVLQVGDRAFVLLAHLRSGSVAVRAGQQVTAGRPVGACGSSGNTTQPHLHVQAMDAADPYRAHGLPLAFRRYRTWSRRGEASRVVDLGVPREREVLERADPPAAVNV